MRIDLVSIDMWTPVLKFTLEHLPTVVGRTKHCDIQLDNRWVSRKHCEISEDDGAIIALDLSSKHGILINGELASRAVLKPGDQLTIGIRTFEVHYEATPGKSPRRVLRTPNKTSTVEP